MALTKEQVAAFKRGFDLISDNIEKAVFGKKAEIRLVLAAMISEGHVLLEDFPGTGKTALARALAETIRCENKRIQFTPDLLPSDVTGMEIYNQKTQVFKFEPGPVFANIVLADEINRAGPKTQSALLQAMEEGKVNVGKVEYELPMPFLVIATQNPVEQEGVYPLPEAQLDRFMIKTSLGYPDAESTKLILTGLVQSGGKLAPAVSSDDVRAMTKYAREVAISDELIEYIVKIVEQTRNSKRVEIGSSVRGARNLAKLAKTWALTDGRDYVVANDIKSLAVTVLAHRLKLNPELEENDGVKNETVMLEILNSITPPKDPSK
jgi:MoxR-like ATPase